MKNGFSRKPLGFFSFRKNRCAQEKKGYLYKPTCFLTNKISRTPPTALNRSISGENMSPLRPIDIMVGVIPPRDQDQLMHKSSPGDEIKRGYKYTQRIVDKW